MENNVETFAYSSFEVTEMRPSKYREGHSHRITVGVRCPRCDRKNPHLEHGEKGYCFCGLAMQKFGNALQVWEPRVLDHVTDKIRGIVGK